MSAATPKAEERLRFPGVRAPKPLLAPEAEARLTERQRQLLDELERILTGDGLAELTMAEIAARANCSLRTLYGLAPSKEELALTVVDRRLHRIGRKAIASLDASLAPLGALRAYLEAANEAVQPETVTFARSFAKVPGAKRLIDSHEEYVIAVVRSLLDRAVAEGHIASVDTASLAHLLGGLGREFARPDMVEIAAAPPKATANAMMEIILRGVERG